MLDSSHKFIKNQGGSTSPTKRGFLDFEDKNIHSHKKEYNNLMELTEFFAKFWGSLLMLLGAMSFGGGLLKRVIGYTEDLTITISTGYITMLLGLVTVVAHNVWVWDWPVVITILGWSTLIKGVLKVGFPGHINKQAQMFKGAAYLWGAAIFIIGAFIFWIGIK